jgi:hypothetical protein
MCRSHVLHRLGQDCGTESRSENRHILPSSSQSLPSWVLERSRPSVYCQGFWPGHTQHDPDSSIRVHRAITRLYGTFQKYTVSALLMGTESSHLRAIKSQVIIRCFACSTMFSPALEQPPAVIMLRSSPKPSSVLLWQAPLVMFPDGQADSAQATARVPTR